MEPGNPLEQASMDAIEMLSSDHARVTRFYEKFRSAESPEERQEIADDILSDLTAHAMAEEQVFYPALAEASPDMREMLAHSKEEHDEMKKHIEAIRGMKFAQGYEDHLDKLVSTVSHHVTEEEAIVFPKAQEALAGELDALAKNMMAVKLPVLGKEKLMELGR